MRGWTVLACVVLLAGCGRSAFVGPAGHAGGTALFLPGAGEEAAGPDDFVEEAEKPTPALEKKEEPVEEARERRPLGLGVRVGVLLPGAGEKEDYSAAPLVGLFWRPGRNGSRFAYEIEIGYRQGESASGLEQSMLVAGHANGLWHFASNEVLSAYAVGGVGLISEQVKDEDLGSSSVLGSALDLGAGVTTYRGLDVRVSYSFLLGSENVGGLFGVLVGMLF